jgi:hypothetical protein
VPPLIRRYIKTSFVFLLVGLSLGGYMTISRFVVGARVPPLFVTAHVHLLLVGFVLMLVIGVATWMFPRPARDDALLAAAGGLGQLAAAVLFVGNMWSRVRMPSASAPR